jgi:dihydroorotase-like cyclic amidohydrolase
VKVVWGEGRRGKKFKGLPTRQGIPGAGCRAHVVGSDPATQSTVATDVLYCSRDLKLGGRTIEDTVGGSTAAEERVGITYTEGVMKRGMSLPRFADAVSTNAAKDTWDVPVEGRPRARQRLFLLDPTIRKRLSVADLHGADHSVWEGWEIYAWPVSTILRGKVNRGERKASRRCE